MNEYRNWVTNYIQSFKLSSKAAENKKVLVLGDTKRKQIERYTFENNEQKKRRKEAQVNLDSC